MATIIKLTVYVDELSEVLSKFDVIKIYRSNDGISGTYTEITTTTTRIPLQQGVTSYDYTDVSGEITYYYKTSYFHSGTGLESNLSEARLGDDPGTANIMSINDLKQIYLFGLDLTDDAGNEFPDLMFEWGIRWAIANAERHLDIKIRPTALVERHDYYAEDYQNWTLIRLREAPVVSVEAVTVKWPSDTNVITFPDEWIQLLPEEGQINIVPTSGSLSQVLLTAGGSFLPLIAAGRRFVPGILEVQFTAGFAEGQVPMDIRDLIGKWACFAPLNVAGDLIVGAGIASKSVSLDGLSTSISSTSSATNAGYGARLLQYQKEIKEVVPTLKRYYKGIRMTAL